MRVAGTIASSEIAPRPSSEISLLAIVPATRMPGRRKGDLPEKLEPDDDDVIDEVADTDRVAGGVGGVDGVDDKEAVA